MKQQLINVVKTLVVEQPAKRAGLAKLKGNLERSQQEINARLDALTATDEAQQAKRHKTLIHIIAIERWGQARLRVLLGEAFKQDENHAYKPAEDTSWADLRQMFNDTRAGTLELLETMPQEKWSMTVPHNQLGDMSGLGWLRYLSGHAGSEAKRIK